MRRGMTQSVGEMRLEQAELARDAKRERAMCAYGGCQSSHNLKDAPEGYTGPYGGDKLCPEHYRTIVDYIAKHGHLPSEE